MAMPATSVARLIAYAYSDLLYVEIDEVCHRVTAQQLDHEWMHGQTR